MDSTPHVPSFSTEEFRSNFFLKNKSVDQLFKAEYEHFLIAKFCDFKSFIKIPTSFYKRSVAQLFFITKGHMLKGCNLEKVTIGANQIHLWLPHQVATIEHFSDDIEGFYCHFDLDLLEHYSSPYFINELYTLQDYMHYSAVNLPQDAVLSIENICTRLYQIYHNQSNKDLTSSYLYILLNEIKRNTPIISIESTSNNRATELTKAFKKLLFQNIEKEQNLHFYANQLCITQNHLNKSIKQITGKTASTWLYDILILEAKVQLNQGNLSIGDVAFSLGFESQSYFSKFFKKHTGILPSQFRKNMSKPPLNNI
ncbi:helix-turn-helix domain-containing protein [Aquimarina rhabdastrellae]